MNFNSIHSGVKTLLAALAVLVFQSCSPLSVPPPSPAMNEESVTAVLSAFAGQENAANTLFFSGTLTLKNQSSENSVQILMIADAAPHDRTKSAAYREGNAQKGVQLNRRIKIELTHPWGKALMHILVDGVQVDILNFREKRLYRGSLSSQYLASRLPVPLNLKILWSLARAFPALFEYQSAESFAGNQIALMDEKGQKIQVFELYSSEPLPFKVSFCEENASMVFSDWQDEDGILYARQMKFRSPDQKISLGIEIDQIRFNTLLPKAVFGMAAPQDFTTVPLKDDRSEH